MSGPIDIIPTHPPRWAEVFGEDDFGIFAEFELGGVAFVWRWVPPGTFLMGSPEGENGFDRERPRHEVTLSEGFWLGEAPVTQEQWQVADGNPSHFTDGEDSSGRPVESVSWDSVCAYAVRLAKAVPELYPRLPTEAQWERACRAGTESPYNDGGDELDHLGWFANNSDSSTHTVKQKKPNGWGLYEMHGNVWEWCWDGRCRYDGEAQLNPVGSGDSAHRVVRGGSYADTARNCRSACRSWSHREARIQDIGLRLAAGQLAEPGKD